MLRKILFVTLILGSLCLLIDGRTCNADDQAATEQMNPMPLNLKAAGGSRFVGDINGDGVMDPADMVYLISYLFRGGPPPPVMEDADLNEDGVVNSADVITLYKWLWQYTA